MKNLTCTYFYVSAIKYNFLILCDVKDIHVPVCNLNRFSINYLPYAL